MGPGFDTLGEIAAFALVTDAANSVAVAETDALISCAAMSGCDAEALALVGLFAGSVAVNAEGKSGLAGKPPISSGSDVSFSSAELAFVAETAFMIAFDVASTVSERNTLCVSVAALDRGSLCLI